MSKWRSTKTKPRAGKEVLIVCHFENGREVRIAKYQTKATIGPHGRFCWGLLDDGGSVAANCVTHWRHLPKLPLR